MCLSIKRWKEANISCSVSNHENFKLRDHMFVTPKSQFDTIQLNINYVFMYTIQIEMFYRKWTEVNRHGKNQSTAKTEMKILSTF